VARKKASKNKKFLDAHETAEKLDVAVATVYAAVKAGTLPSIRIGKVIRIPASAVEG
jgi:excisionase family DNA binding protein